jgi:hypothetical protein
MGRGEEAMTGIEPECTSSTGSQVAQAALASSSGLAYDYFFRDGKNPALCCSVDYSYKHIAIRIA